MSWQEYVDKNLMCAVDAEGNTLTSGALVGHDGSVWAHSPNFPAANFTAAEAKAIMDILNGSTEHQGAFTMGGVKYYIINSDDPETKLRGKCASGGAAISKTTQTLVVGIWAEPVTGGACNKVVEHLAEYLLSVNY